MDTEGNENTNQQPEVLTETLDKIFSKREYLLEKRNSFKSHQDIPVKELEVALTVLLVDLASCDQEFDQTEYQAITKGLARVFGTSKTEVQALVNQATMTISNMRGVNSFANLLKSNLSNEDKQIVLDVIDEIIEADGHEDGFETYLRAKFVDQLGLESE